MSGDINRSLFKVACRTYRHDHVGIYEATALISFFNFSGRMEAVSGLPLDQVPDAGQLAEARPDGRG